MVGLVPCTIRPDDSDGADRLGVSSRNACYRKSSHQHRFSQAGLHPAGPSTSGLRMGPAAPDFACTLASPSHQPSSCVAVLLAPVHSVLRIHRNLEMLISKMQHLVLASDSARVRGNKTLLSKLYARHSRSRRVSYEHHPARA
jgi:hypothetical protein